MKKITVLSIIVLAFSLITQVSLFAGTYSQNGKEIKMGAPYLSGVTKLEIREIAAAGDLPNSAFGTANLELLNPLAEGTGISYESAVQELGSGEDLNAGQNTSLEFMFSECQSSTGATEANLEAACRNNKRVQIKATFPSGAITYGGSNGVLFQFGHKIEPKTGIKKFILKAKKFSAQKSDVIA